ncbi:MAG: VPS10 domain-containing protein, partial [bacterium]
MGARVSAIAVPDGKEHLYTFYVGFWTGGLWKTTNNGTTFEPIFDGHDKLAIGAVAMAPANPDILWVGTGDAFTSRSSLLGDGVYKSLDAGKTWTNVGLKDSHHISRIAIDPANPNTVYVAAMGHLFSENPERGVFKTINGGRTWEKVLYVNEGVGVIDLVMHPKNPAVLYAATYDKKRMPWQIVNGGPGTAIYKTLNGGKTWSKLAGGLPTGQIGRIGLTMYPGNPEILYAVIENENPRNGATTRQGYGEVYRTQDGGKTWTRMSGTFNVSPKGPYYFSQIFV